MPDSAGAIDLGALSDEESQAVDDMIKKAKQAGAGDPGPEPKIAVSNAFIVFTGRDGTVQVAGIDSADQFTVDTEIPTEDQIFSAASTVVKDITVGSTARATVEFQMAQAMHMQEQAQSAELARRLNLPGRN